MPVVARPNIVLCLFDSLSASDRLLSEHLSCMPVLSDLLGKSSVFTHAYTPNPESSPARASLFTGLDPCVHGLWTNGVTLPANEQTFVRVLAQAGYTNYLAGRYQLSGVSQWIIEAIRAGEFTQAEWAHGPLHRSRQNAYLGWVQAEAPEYYSTVFENQAIPDNTLATWQQVEALQALPHKLGFNSWVGEKTSSWIKAQPPSQPFLAIAGFSVGQQYGAEPVEGFFACGTSSSQAGCGSCRHSRLSGCLE